MKLQHIDEGEKLLVDDPIHLDFIYVSYGVIKVVLEKKYNDKIDH
jgi:hypothetical protein